jgi:hypothetical protein
MLGFGRFLQHWLWFVEFVVFFLSFPESVMLSAGHTCGMDYL